MRRFLYAKRLVLCLGMLGLFGLTSGCGDENPVTSAGPDVSKNGEKGKAQAEALRNAYGTTSIPKSTKSAPKK